MYIKEDNISSILIIGINKQISLNRQSNTIK